MPASVSRRVLKNFGVVLRGRGVAALLMLAATALMANSLRPEEFGLVILVHTYVLTVRGLLNFRTYDAIVRFGVPLHEKGDEEGLKNLIRTTTFIDAASAIVAALVGFFASATAGRYLHWDAQMVSVASLYSLVLLTTVTNTPNGVLRIYDRFDAIGVYYTVGPLIRISGTLIAWSVDASMVVFILIWAAAFVLENSWLAVRGQLELRKQVSGSLWRGGDWGAIRKTSREFRSFIAVVYWQTNIDLLPKHGAVLLAGGLLGPAAAGMFRLARDFSGILSKPAMMLRDVLFPDLTRLLHSKTEGFHKLGFNAVKVAGAAGLSLVALSIPTAEPILGIIGPDYTEAATLLTLMLLAATFELASAPLRAAAYALGKATAVLRIHLLGVVLYLALFKALIPVMGLSGPGVAAGVGALSILLMMLQLVSRK